MCDKCIASLARSVDTPAHYITSIFSFRDKNVKRIIHSIKYYHRKDLVLPLANSVAKELKRTLLGKEYDQNLVLVPIPMPKIRKFMRGYNQSEIIAEKISSMLSLPVKKDILVRTRSPKRQVKTNTRVARLTNQHNSFKVLGDIKNLHIILIDDVATTGATLDEARKVLLKSGASSVVAVTIAH